MRFLFAFFCFTLSFQSFAQQPLVGNKNGRWIIFEGNQVVNLPESYVEVGNFDSTGTAFFYENGNYGILNTTGQVILAPIFRKIESLGSGFFGAISINSNFIVHHRNGEVSLDSCLRWKKVEKNWVSVVQNNDENYVLNIPTGKKWKITSPQNLVQHNFNYVELFEREETIVLNPKGEKISLADGFAVFREDYVRLKSKERDVLIFNNSQLELPIGVLRLEFKDDLVEYSTANRTVHQTRTGEVKLDVPYTNIEPGGLGRYIVSKDFKYGVIDTGGNELIPLKYTSLERNNFTYAARTEKGLGIIDLDGNQLVPCQFKRAYKAGAFYKVYSDFDLVGLYSTKRKKLILETNYENIAISQDKIRGWINGSLRILTYDEEHRITKDFILGNTVSKFNVKNVKDIDPRLFGIGWFYEEVPIFDEEGFSTNSITRWGLKNHADSIITNPRFPMPRYVPQMNFSLMYTGETNAYWYTQELEKTSTFSAIDATNGKFMDLNRILSIDSADIFSRNYVRYTSEDGLGYITTDNKVHPLVYMDFQNHTILRVASSKVLSFVIAKNSDPEGVYFYGHNLGEYPLKLKTWEDGPKTSEKIKFLKADWNFLDTNGRLLFNEPFEFVNNFKLGRSIVKKNGKWGVCSKDSMMIPAFYSSIKRIEELGDTIFQVQLSTSGERYMDTLTNDFPYKIDRFIKRNAHFSIVESNKKYLALDSRYNELVSSEKSFRMIDGNGYFERQNREYTVYDYQGKPIISSFVKPEKVVFDQFVVFKDGSKFGMVDGFGDTLLNPVYKSILQKGNYILAEGSSTIKLLKSSGEIADEIKSGNFLIDEISGNFARSNGKKVLVFDSKGNKLGKIRKINPDLFANNVFIEFGSNSKYKSLVELADSLPDNISEYLELDGSGHLLTYDDESYYFDSNWKCLNKGKPFFKVKYLGEGVISAKGDTSNLLFSAHAEMHFTRGTRFGSFQEGIGQVFCGSEMWYVDSNFETLFNRKFNQGTQFDNGYAAVQENDGWTVIDRNGHVKSISSYTQIIPLGNNIFSTTAPPKIGVIDGNGKVILEAVYQRVEVLNGDVFQAVKNGTFYYFKLDGTPIPY